MEIIIDSFDFFGAKLNYIQQNNPKTAGGHPHIGERTVEIPISKCWLSRFDPTKVIELGAVMPWFWNAETIGKSHLPTIVPHTVVDPTDSYVNCVKQDGEFYSYSGYNVLSISTIEHIGLAEYGLIADIDKAKRVLDKIINESVNYLIDWPLGYNRKLDEYFKEKYRSKNDIKYFMMKQITADNRWKMIDEDWSLNYGSPFMYANGIIFVTNNIDWVNYDDTNNKS